MSDKRLTLVTFFIANRLAVCARYKPTDTWPSGCNNLDCRTGSHIAAMPLPLTASASCTFCAKPSQQFQRELKIKQTSHLTFDTPVLYCLRHLVGCVLGRKCACKLNMRQATCLTCHTSALYCCSILLGSDMQVHAQKQANELSHCDTFALYCFSILLALC